MQRRQMIRLTAAGLAALALPAIAQQERRVRRIGALLMPSAKSSADWLAGFREGMTALHWTEGRDYVIDARYGNGVSQTGPSLAAELVATQPDLILTGADEAIHQLAQRTKTIPIIFTIAQDPVGNGLISSLQRPGGNATGLTSLARELGGKRLQLLKEAFPQAAHVAFLSDPGDSGSIAQEKEAREAAETLKIRLTTIDVRQSADIEPAIKRGAVLGVQAYVVPQVFLFNSNYQATVDGMLRARIPAVFGNDQAVELGGLMSYSISYRDNFRRAAIYVDKIFKGAKPGDLPTEQPVKFKLALNLKSAIAMGIKFPPSILLQADKVIE